MSSTTWLTTADAEEIYHIPAQTFAAWCRDGKIKAQKESGEWRMTQEALDAFFASNPNPNPSTPRRLWAVIERFIWPIFVVVATVLGFVNDTFNIPAIVGAGSLTWLWLLLTLFGIVLWIGAWYLLRGRRNVLLTTPMRTVARALLWGIPVLATALFIGYNTARVDVYKRQG